MFCNGEPDSTSEGRTRGVTDETRALAGEESPHSVVTSHALNGDASAQIEPSAAFCFSSISKFNGVSFKIHSSELAPKKGLPLFLTYSHGIGKP